MKNKNVSTACEFPSEVGNKMAMKSLLFFGALLSSHLFTGAFSFRSPSILTHSKCDVLRTFNLPVRPSRSLVYEICIPPQART